MDQSHSDSLRNFWAGVLGMIALITGTFQYLPQLVATFMDKKFGALSIGSLLMQAPGSFLFVYSLAIQPGTNWTSWISFAVCGTFQFILILMYIVFEKEVSTSENEPLLSGEGVVLDDGFGDEFVDDFDDSLIEDDNEPLQNCVAIDLLDDTLAQIPGQDSI